ncbi:hypothetical protein SOVF_080190 isoform B [Spinacia oleracea]|uniref:Uncharacterized protein isoform X2 n=1 Tax=Spinacia oleracea TaxID=3562 RepID=A0A9R0I6Z1_SPIOL|nr:uncharacterized protein LOC110783735 isoform X2 [Spinacia oleracea]KNA17404.1 hypothetical protein SOVF_080190 isoform B [Spinacia oleracea]
MIRGYRDSPFHQDEQLRWNHHSIFQDNPRNGAPAGYRPFEETPVIRPFGLTSNNTGHGDGMNPRFPQSSQRIIPRYTSNESTHVPTETDDDSKLTKEEQVIVLKKLKKEIYNPMPKILARRVSLYYRDVNRDITSKSMEKHKDEDGKSCAVCLEDFEAREEVMVTPCSHMFHEECVVPWVKNHGDCPVCRATFYERRERLIRGQPFNDNNRGVRVPALFSDELLSLFQSLDEAFPWRFLN